MQEVFCAIIFGLVQGFFEFLPVSSSAHLCLLQSILQVRNFDEIKFFASLGSFLVILFYFLPLLMGECFGLFKGQKSSFNFFTKLAAATLPICIIAYMGISIGFSFQMTGLFLILGSFLMVIAERIKKENHVSVERVTLKGALIIGFFQALSVFSGFSRSGSTMCGGLICGLSRQVAVKFCFLISIPVTILTIIHDSLKLEITNLKIDLIVLISSFLIGQIAIKHIMRFLSNNPLYLFVFYRIALACIII